GKSKQEAGMSHSTTNRDGIAPEEPRLRSGAVVIGVSNRFNADVRSLRTAAAWAARRHLDVELVVGLDRTAAGDEVYQAGTEQRRRFALAEIERFANHLALLMDPGQRIHSTVSDQSAVDALVGASESAGLLVLQRRRMGPITRLRVGSTSADVAARSVCPVLILHADDRAEADTDGPRAVLVGVDERGHGEHAIAEAFAEASWRNVPLTAVHAWAPAVPTYLPPGALEGTESHTAIAAGVAEQLAGYRSRYPDVTLRQLVVEGEPVPVLLDLARDHDLLVVARHTEGHRTRRDLGSTARRVIEEAPCPVLITPSGRPAAVARHRHAREPQTQT
ncbi:MAG TPA: universal stress protein, partial [Microlunatus sp.]|nr:universal stress protein [Microlunatus sp.]